MSSGSSGSGWLGWRGLLEWWRWDGVLSRRGFFCLLGFWLLVCSAMVFLVAGRVPWLEPVGGLFSRPVLWVEAPAFVILWVVVSAGLVRRWRETLLPWWPLALIWFFFIVLAPTLFGLLACIVVGLVPRAGWWSRLVEARASSRGGRRVSAVGLSPAVVEGPSASASAVEAPVLESVEDMREWLYGDGE